MSIFRSTVILFATLSVNASHVVFAAVDCEYDAAIYLSLHDFVGTQQAQNFAKNSKRVCYYVNGKIKNGPIEIRNDRKILITDMGTHSVDKIYLPNEPIFVEITGVDRIPAHILDDGNNCMVQVQLKLLEAHTIELRLDESSHEYSELLTFKGVDLEPMSLGEGNPCPEYYSEQSADKAKYKLDSQNGDLQVYYEGKAVFQIPSIQLQKTAELRLGDFPYSGPIKKIQKGNFNNASTGLFQDLRKLEIEQLRETLLLVTYTPLDDQQ